MGFQGVAEPKVVKNRVHVDLKVVDGGWDAEVACLEGVGARAVRLVDEHADESHMIMQDREGNECCLVRPMSDMNEG